MVYYILVVLSAILFSLQFLFQQKYQENCGNGIISSLGFSLYKGIAVVVMMALLCGFKFEFAMFSFLLSGLNALCYILMIFFSLKAFSVANLSVYSVFTMLGGMLVPFVAGVTFYQEKLTGFKVVCCLLIVLAVLMNIQKGRGSKKAFLYYILVFALNGTIATISKVHEASSFVHTGPHNFMIYYGLWTILICSGWILLKGGTIPLYKGKNLIYSVGDGFFNGIGDLLLLIAIARLDASVQYPLVTGGVMIFSTFISIIRHEKIRKIEYFAAIVAFVASILMAVP